MADEKTGAQTTARRHDIPRDRRAASVVGKDTLTSDLPATDPTESFEFSILEARVQRQALETALDAGDEITVAITAPALTAALDAARRAIESAPPGRTSDMRATLEPLVSDAARLLARRDAADLNTDRLVAFAVREVDGDQRYKILLNVVVQAQNRGVLPQVAHELRTRPHPVHGNYLDALTRLIRVKASGGLRDLVLGELERAGVGPKTDAAVARMTALEKLTEAALLGVPDIPREALSQVTGMIIGIPIAIGVGALIAAGVIPSSAAAILLVPAGIQLADELTAYRDLALEARTVADLRAAGSYFAKVLVTLGIAALTEFARKVKLGRVPERVKPIAKKAPAPRPRFQETKPITLDPTRGAGKTISGWTRSGWKFEVTMGGANEVATLSIKVTIKNVQSAARAPTSTTKAFRTFLHDRGLISDGKDAGHGVASAIATCEDLLNYFNETSTFNRYRKAPAEVKVIKQIERWRAAGEQVTLETEMFLKDAPGIPEIVRQRYELISSSGERSEPIDVQ